MSSTALKLNVPAVDEVSTGEKSSDFSDQAHDLLRKHFDASLNRGSLQPGSNSGPAILSTPTQGLEPNDDPLPAELALKLRPSLPQVVSFYALQQWDGWVLEIGTESFRARLTDLESDRAPDTQEADIPFSELDEATVAELSPGRLFRWAIGYERERSGQKRRVSQIVLRRLPAWTASELQKAKEDAARSANEIKWD